MISKQHHISFLTLLNFNVLLPKVHVNGVYNSDIENPTSEIHQEDSPPINHITVKL